VNFDGQTENPAMEREPQKSPAIPRRGFRFGMRGLLAFMVLCGLASKVGSQATAYHAEQRVLKELQVSGFSFPVAGQLAVFC
jgi:hypothetical protein